MNSHKMYVKYYQKTAEMSIKNIEDSLNNVNNISSKIDTNETNISSLNKKYESVLWRSNNNNDLINQSSKRIDSLEKNYFQ